MDEAAELAFVSLSVDLSLLFGRSFVVSDLSGTRILSELAETTREVAFGVHSRLCAPPVHLAFGPANVFKSCNVPFIV